MSNKKFTSFFCCIILSLTAVVNLTAPTFAQPAENALRTPAGTNVKRATPSSMASTTLPIVPTLPNWPTHSVRILVGFPAGSTPDMIARAISEPLAKELGQPVIVENHVGVAGNLAAQMLSKATDDHTLGILINGNLTTAKLLYPSLGFDPLSDFTPISLIASSPLVLVAPNQLPSGRAFFQAAREASTHWNYGSVGTGSIAHLGMEALKALLPGTEPVHVPYAGNPAVLGAVMAGEIQMALVPIGVAMPLVNSGKIQAIGISGSKSTLAPNIPSLSSLGIKGYASDMQVWDALVGPKTLSPQALIRLSKAVSLLNQNPELRNQLFNQGWQLRSTDGEGLKNVSVPEYELMKKLIKQLNLKLDP